VGDWRIDPSTGRLQREGKELKLEPKVMTVLVCLAQQAGAVITREQLESTAWAGRVVGYDSLASTIIKLRKAFGDDSRKPRFIETVPKRGYRLIAPVRPAQSDREQNAAIITRTHAPAATSAANRSVPVILFGVAALIGIAVWLISGDGPSVSEAPGKAVSARPSIAVLPFKNISNDPEQDYFSDGITADLITELSKVSGLSVIARNSVFAYKNIPVDVRKIGAELNVRYIIEGSVRKAGNEVRISARLIDAGNGYNLWAERFDGELKNVFALQDEVTSRIVSSLEVRLTDKERIRLAHDYTDSIEAYESFLHGWQHFWEFSKDGNRHAREYYQKAIELDNTFARAYANLALTHAYDFINGWSENPDHSLKQAGVYAQKGVELDTSLPQVHWAMGLTEIFNKNYKEALAEAEQAIRLDPNFADGYGLLATTLNYAAKPKSALEVMQKAMRLNPRHPFIYKVICGEIHFNLHDYQNAVEYFTQALERNPEAQEARLWLAAAYAHAGRIDDAKWEIEQIRSRGAELSVERIEQTIPLKDPLQREHLVEGLYKAGLEDN
jgi:TolB-like protein/DNA-binding winged helix-turn-helix (wHTH) protein/Flp pilus assembly protein TadD